jgi:hypothetical protein
MSGVKGKSTVKAGRWELKSMGKARERLVATESGMREAFRGRNAFRVVRTNAIAHSAPFASTSYAFANQSLLPPFIPFGRSQDSAFGIFLGLLNRTAFVGHIPLAVTHAPKDIRTYQSIPDYQLADLVCDTALSFERPYVQEPDAVLRSIGRDLIEVSELPREDFWAFVTKQGAAKKAGTLRGFAGSLEDFPGAPEYWHEEVSRYHEDWCSYLTAPEYFVPIELRQAFPREAMEQKTGTFLRRMGALLDAWPDILEAARQLKKREIRISRQIERA